MVTTTALVLDSGASLWTSGLLLRKVVSIFSPVITRVVGSVSFVRVLQDLGRRGGLMYFELDWTGAAAEFSGCLFQALKR